MTIKQLIDKVLVHLKSLLPAASDDDKAALRTHISKIESSRQALESNLEGRVARENGERQKIQQNHSKAIDFLRAHGPSLSTDEKKARAESLVAELQAFPKEDVDILADFLAKGLEAEWLEKCLRLLQGLTELGSLSDASKAELEQTRKDAVNLSVEAALDDGDLEKLRTMRDFVNSTMSFLGDLSVDPKVDVNTGLEVNKFVNSWQIDFLKPITRGLLSTRTADYALLRSSLAQVNKELDEKLQQLVQLVESIKALNEFLGFFSKILTFALA